MDKKGRRVEVPETKSFCSLLLSFLYHALISTSSVCLPAQHGAFCGFHGALFLLFHFRSLILSPLSFYSAYSFPKRTSLGVGRT